MSHLYILITACIESIEEKDGAMTENFQWVKIKLNGERETEWEWQKERQRKIRRDKEWPICIF